MRWDALQRGAFPNCQYLDLQPWVIKESTSCRKQAPNRGAIQRRATPIPGDHTAHRELCTCTFQSHLLMRPGEPTGLMRARGNDDVVGVGVRGTPTGQPRRIHGHGVLQIRAGEEVTPHHKDALGCLELTQQTFQPTFIQTGVIHPKHVCRIKVGGHQPARLPQFGHRLWLLQPFSLNLTTTHLTPSIRPPGTVAMLGMHGLIPPPARKKPLGNPIQPYMETLLNPISTIKMPQRVNDHHREDVLLMGDRHAAGRWATEHWSRAVIR